jgi:hypothetical protein
MADMLTPRFVGVLLVTTLMGCAGRAGGPAAGGAGATETSTGECPVVGTWVGQVPDGPLAGRTLTMVFAEDGTARGTCDWVTLNSRWQRNGNLVDVIDVSATPAFARCDPSVVGRYSLEFESGCGSVRTVSGEDLCSHRRAALLGFRAARQ